MGYIKRQDRKRFTYKELAAYFQVDYRTIAARIEEKKTNLADPEQVIDMLYSFAQEGIAPPRRIQIDGKRYTLTPEPTIKEQP